MRKKIIIALGLIASLCLVGCSSQTKNDNSNTTAVQGEANTNEDNNNDTKKEDNGETKENDTANKKLSIVTTIFPAFDFSRSIVGDKGDVTLLLKPGQESHSFDPTPQDIIKIQNCDLFVYIGGESDEWVDKMLESLGDKKPKVLKLMDQVKLIDEVVVSGMQVNEDEEEGEEEEEKDEHIWTSIENDIVIAKSITDTLSEISADNKDYFNTNLESFTKEYTAMKDKYTDMISNSKLHTIVVGDRFPFAYFAKEFNLKYYAAFPGCSADTEVNPKTIAFLIDKVKKDKIPVVFHIELSNDKIAKAICEATSAKDLLLQSGHNLTAKEFDEGVTYLDLLNQNFVNLKEALN